MSEEDTKDCSSIKLFGQTIGLQQMSPDITDTATEQRPSSSVESNSQPTKCVPTEEYSESPTSSSEKTPKEDEPVESQENTALKKPDKLLSCPRCKSPDTKFCYYNNYNIKQPRHFCKNCQRYWTSGGTMREVPVGSGRRKRKDTFPSEHEHRHLKVLDAPTSGFFIFCPDHRGLNSSGFPFAFYPEPNTQRKLRIVDPREAAKSSIWSTLGKREKIGSANKMCLFEAFETKGDRNRGTDNTTIALQANPAAFSRSLKFHEHA